MAWGGELPYMPPWVLVMEAAEAWGMAPWDVVAQCNETWWKRWLAWRRIKADIHADSEPTE